MKKNHYSTAAAVIILVLALLSAIGVRTFMSPCVHDDGSFGSCHWAGQALFGLSLLIATQSVIALVWKDLALRQGLYHQRDEVPYSGSDYRSIESGRFFRSQIRPSSVEAVDYGDCKEVKKG